MRLCMNIRMYVRVYVDVMAYVQMYAGVCVYVYAYVCMCWWMWILELKSGSSQSMGNSLTLNCVHYVPECSNLRLYTYNYT